MQQILALVRLRLRLGRDFLPFQLAVDLLLPLGVAGLLATGTPAGARPRLALGVLLVSSVLSLFRLPAFLLMMDRVFGRGELLASAGVDKSAYLASQAVGALGLSLLPIVAYGGACLWLQTPIRGEMSFWTAYGLYAAVLYGGSLTVGSVFRDFNGFTATINSVVLVTAAICPVYYPLEQAPPVLQPVLELLPPGAAAQLMSSPRPAVVGLLSLGVWALALLVVGHRCAAAAR